MVDSDVWVCWVLGGLLLLGGEFSAQSKILKSDGGKNGVISTGRLSPREKRVLPECRLREILRKKQSELRVQLLCMLPTLEV